MAIRQTRIFVLSKEPLENWAETILGKVICPLTNDFMDSLEWFWFSRYVNEIGKDESNCKMEGIPDEYKQALRPDGPGIHRSLRFRYNIKDNQRESFEKRAEGLINHHSYAISDFRDYNFVADTGSTRFLGVEKRFAGRNAHRALLATQFYMATSRLVLDALVGPDNQGRFKFETADDLVNNPQKSTFQSFLHLFCNITNVPTYVYVFQKIKPNLIDFGTSYSSPEPPRGGWDSATPIQIRF